MFTMPMSKSISKGLPCFTIARRNKLRFFLLCLAFLGEFLIQGQAYADWGTRMLAFKCDEIKNEIVFQPFIQWNENYFYQGLQFEPSQERSTQLVRGYNFFSPKSFENKILKITCGIQSRTIKFFLDGVILTIVDVDGKNSWAREINLSEGSAWDVYGPLYNIRSNQFRHWEECRARGDIAAIDIKYICTSITSIEE